MNRVRSRLPAVLRWALLPIFLLGLLTPAGAGPPPGPAAMPGQPGALYFYGINGYFSGYERSTAEVNTLLPLGPAVGLMWTREEFVWANIEYYEDSYNFDFPDDRVWRMGNAGYGIIGMLLTTPTWARKPSCAGNYWCPPKNPQDYYEFVRDTVEHYDGDGYADAPASPRVAYWEIWNEPNDPANWLGTPAEYAALLKAGYAGVKEADPTAQVLVGSVYVFDGVSGGAPAYDGLVFLSNVLAADPTAWNAFDILGIHPHMPDVAPDKPGLMENVTMLARMQHALNWVAARGGGKPVWVTEVGWSTCTAGQGDCTPALAKTEVQQADYLLRTMAMGRAKGLPHVSVFQLEDKFDGSQSKMWGGCAIIKPAAQNYAPKLAHHAIAVMVQQLSGASYLGPGPLHGLQWEEIGTQRRLSAYSRFDYRFTTVDGGYVDILWRPDEQNETVAFPVGEGWTVTWVERDGQEHPLVPSGGYVYFTINGHPGYLRQQQPPLLRLSTDSVGFLTVPGQQPGSKTLYLSNAGGGTLTWTATLSAGDAWFDAAPLAGTAPATVTVTAAAPTTTGLFTGTLYVDAGIAGQQEVRLWMRVAPSLWPVYLPLVP